MYFYIQKLKISNFLSFFNEYDVCFEPLTGIICNYLEGKDDFFRCLEFVFGADLKDLRIDNCLQLVHKVLREEFLLSGQNIRSSVQITLRFPNEEKHLTFCRSIINRNGLARIEYSIGDIIITKEQYEEELCSLGLYIKRKNLIFYQQYFDDVVWNSSENLEKTISNCLRIEYLAEEWKKSKKEVKYLTKLKSDEAEKNYNSIKTSHFLIAKYTDTFESINSKRERLHKKIIQNFQDTSFEDSYTSITDQSEEGIKFPEFEKQANVLKVYNLELKNEYLRSNLQKLRQKEAELTSQIYHEEIKLVAKPVNSSIIQKRMSELKNKIKEKEKTLSEIWRKTKENEMEIENISKEISKTMIFLREIQNNVFLKDRFTKYGRFSDYLQPSPYLQTLKDIIGTEIFNAHLCDSLESGFSAMEMIKAFEHRETIIPFECYSHKLKDIIIASGEKGVEINTVEQLLIFLCKLKHYGLIDKVPGVIRKNFDFEEELPNGYVIYLQGNLQISDDGLITYKYESTTFNMETEEDLRKKLVLLQTHQEEKYEGINELFFQKYETLNDLISLDNDLKYLQRKWRQSKPKLISQAKTFESSDIYKEYIDIFNRYFEEYKEQEQQDSDPELIISDSPPGIRSSATSSDESLQSIITALEEINQQKTEIKEELKVSITQLQSFYRGPFWDIKIRSKPVIFNRTLDKTRMFFEKEFRKLKKSLAQDDFEFFISVQEWRKIAINSLLKNYEEIKTRLGESAESFKSISSERQRKVYPLIQHLNDSLTDSVCNLLSENRSVKVNWTPDEENVQLMSFIEKNGTLVEIQHLNSFLRFLIVLSMFLEIAEYEKIPVIVFDNIEDYLPLRNDDVECVLNEFEPQTQNPRFSLLMSIGQCFDHYITKNRPNENVPHRNAKDEITGPMQIIFIAKEDLIHSATHFIWIHNQVLPEEFISEDCNSYSQLHELKFDFMN